MKLSAAFRSARFALLDPHRLGARELWRSAGVLRWQCASQVAKELAPEQLVSDTRVIESQQSCVVRRNHLEVGGRKAGPEYFPAMLCNLARSRINISGVGDSSDARRWWHSMRRPLPVTSRAPLSKRLGNCSHLWCSILATLWFGCRLARGWQFVSTVLHHWGEILMSLMVVAEQSGLKIWHRELFSTLAASADINSSIRRNWHENRFAWAVAIAYVPLNQTFFWAAEYSGRVRSDDHEPLLTPDSIVDGDGKAEKAPTHRKGNSWLPSG
jgi:hypothetical protein